MSEFAKMDVFFFVTTVAVAVLTILMIVLMVYAIKITKDIKYISRRAKEEADLLSEDLSDLRENIRGKGFKFKYLWSFFNNLREKRKK